MTEFIDCVSYSHTLETWNELRVSPWDMRLGEDVHRGLRHTHQRWSLGLALPRHLGSIAGIP